MTTTTQNAYLVANFAPVRDERDDTDLAVDGAIPPELDGLLVRNGPNPILDPDPATYHWFSGDGMLHGIELHDGRARYRNRWVRTDAAVDALGEPHVDGQPDEVTPPPSKANTHVFAHAGRIYALVESSLPTVVRTDLSTVGRFDFDGRLRSPMTAHPKIDSTTGEMHFFGADFMGPPFLRYHVADATGALVKTVEVDIPAAVLMHDFGITASHVVFLDFPVVFDLERAMVGEMPFLWKPEHGARVGVMSRAGDRDDTRWTDVEPCYVFHAMNAYDDADGNIVIDVVRYPDMFKVEQTGPGSSSGTTLERWTIDAAAGKVARERLDDTSQEFPRIDDRLAGKPHRYGYATDTHIGEHWSGHGGVRRHDLVAGTTERHDFGPGTMAGEPVFVPASPNAAEDEGWVLSVVYDRSRDSSDLAILDASDFTADPVARVQLRRRVPFGFHGSWVPGAGLG
jgi:carotenoid cleavage dioxygenase-like enzyme